LGAAQNGISMNECDETLSVLEFGHAVDIMSLRVRDQVLLC
jgi:hypothetical protein